MIYSSSAAAAVAVGAVVVVLLVVVVVRPFGKNGCMSVNFGRTSSLKCITYLLTYLLHGAESFLRS